MDFWIYFLQLVACTLGVFFACGLLVHLISFMFSRLLGRGSGALMDLTSIVGTPIHELGHAVMCKLFGHKITKMKLWNPRPTNGVYGYVEHSYSKRNLWARFGNLFIGMGPLFSGLAVTVFVLWLCYPALWKEYLLHSAGIASSETIPAADLISGVFALLKGIPAAFGQDWLRSTLGLAVILPVSLHISLSPQDVKNSLGAMPVVLGFLLLFAFASFWTPIKAPIFQALRIFNLRLVSLFALVIGFSLVWLALAVLIRVIRIFISWF